MLTDDGRIFCGLQRRERLVRPDHLRRAERRLPGRRPGRRHAAVIRAVVVYTPTSEPTAPCGACRQVINEFGPDAEVRCICDGPGELRFRLSELLPAAFGPGNLATPLP